ncbi:ShlB/FhaC/HecB family hemolysin secretion/activation protein [Ancylobacter oerskovii]|uniref:ShlB/FhaC/HecB family hemolysin secretion/activation protein n=1 Tax=Ancylobacter oerskovii TaxID=459519 RepID=A0ABW4YWG3_9HYPH|nr:POTRA domain-containing protein [Ancylobacter oerskovii]MBS7544102.1 ShlB/FhaC/HecB family hemolysin secretion/activation protein [Ancylobacter oerskovii]
MLDKPFPSDSVLRAFARRAGVPRRFAAALLAMVGLALVLFALAAPARAQSSSPAVARITTDQSAIMRQFEPPLTRPPSLGGRISAPVAGLPTDQLAKTRFRLASVTLEGVEALRPSNIAATWQRFLGRDISLEQVKIILEDIEKAYRKDDYGVVVIAPRQDFASGHLRIIVYELYIRELVVNGASEHLRQRLDPYLERITAMRPLRISQVYRQLLLAEDLAGISIYAIFDRIEDDPGAARLQLDITTSRGSVNAALNNYGSPSTGRLQGAMGGQLNDAFGLFEKTDLLAVTNPVDPNDVVLGSLSQSFPLGPSGFGLTYSVGNSWANPGGSPGLDGIHSDIFTASAGVTYALLRAMERNVILSAAVNVNNTDVNLRGEPVSDTRARWVSLAAQYDDTVSGVTFILKPQLLLGIAGLESNLEDTDFSAATLTGVATYSPTKTLTAQLNIAGQYGFTPLPDALLTAYGGEGFGPAYDPAAIVGNSGASVGLKLSQSIDAKLSWLSDFSLFGTIDYGAVWNRSAIPYDFADLGSVGLGVQGTINDHLTAMVMVATPLWYDDTLSALGVEQGTAVRFSLAFRK